MTRITGELRFDYFTRKHCGASLLDKRSARWLLNPVIGLLRARMNGDAVNLVAEGKNPF